MTDEQMRRYIIEIYHNSPRWKRKVNAMPDGQVYRIYVRLKNERGSK